MEYLLEANALTKSYGGHLVLDHLDLALPPGKIVGLLGPNGSGKTTFLKLINRLLLPTSGSVTIAGFAPGVETKRITAYLPERTYLDEQQTVDEILGFFAAFYQDFDLRRAHEMLQALEIPRRTRIRTLSKGTKEKIQLVLVMSRRARLYCLDEPIAGVDPAARDYILDTVLQNYREDASILLSTHLISDVEKVFDDVLFLRNGRLVLSGSVDELRCREGKSVDELFREVFKC